MQVVSFYELAKSQNFEEIQINLGAIESMTTRHTRPHTHVLAISPSSYHLLVLPLFPLPSPCSSNLSLRLPLQENKYCHITSLLKSLHWFPVKHRVVFKVSLITFNPIRPGPFEGGWAGGRGGGGGGGGKCPWPITLRLLMIMK